MATGKGLNWPAEEVKLRPLTELAPHIKNTRTHSEDQIGQIAAAIREWGWTNPVLVDEEGSILAGHGRVMAAERLGIDEVPCMVAKGWSEAQKRAYSIADNQIALQGDWNEDLLVSELEELSEMSFDLDLLGFDELPELGDDEGHDFAGSEDQMGVSVLYLRWKGCRVPITDRELEGLTSALKSYEKRTGTNFGFANHILKSI